MTIYDECMINYLLIQKVVIHLYLFVDKGTCIHFIDSQKLTILQLLNGKRVLRVG